MDKKDLAMAWTVAFLLVVVHSVVHAALAPCGGRQLARAASSRVQLPIAASLLEPPVAATDVWRPTPDDVDRISWGKPAKRKGTGSRGIPHRLNDEVRRSAGLHRQLSP